MIYRVLVIDIRHEGSLGSKISLFVFLLTIVFFVLTCEKRKRFNQAESAKIWSDSESYFLSPMWQWCIHLWNFLSLCFLCVKIKADWGNTAETRARDCFAINLVTDLFFDSTVDSLFLLAIKNRFNEQNKNVINADIPKNKTKGAKSCQTEERRAAGCQWFRNTTENRRVVNRPMWVKPATCLAEHK